MELKKGDKIICITDAYKDFTKGKEYEIFNIDLGDISVKNDYGVSITFLSFHNNFKLKEETEELQPHSFCETPEEKCTLGYCDENGCMNRKRVLVEPELNVAYKETEGKLHYELDFEFITQMAERMASNKKEGKYSMYNWMKPMNKTDLINLIQAQYRHAMDLMNFKFDDDGRPYGTLEAFSNNAMMINYQLKNYFKDYKFSKEDLLELSDKKKGKFKGILSNFKEENEFKNGDKFKFKNKNEQYVFIGKVNDLWFGKLRELAIYRKDNNLSSTMLQPYKDFIKEIQVSPSSKINTTDSTGLLTEEK